MATNARQQYLPASYLARFSADPSRRRDAIVQRLGDDGRFSQTTCASQCAKRNFYSTDSEREAKEWEELEGSWAALVDLIDEIEREVA